MQTTCLYGPLIKSDVIYFLFAAGEGKLILMTRDFDPFLETDVYPSDFGEGDLVIISSYCLYRYYVCICGIIITSI